MTTTHKFPPQDATFDANGVQRGGCAYRNNGNWDCGFSVQFGLPYELGMYRKMGATNDTLRPWGCSAIDIPRQDFLKRPIWGSPVVDCQLNDLDLDGEKAHEVIESFADDHDVWARDFLDAFEKMQANGYDAGELSVGPENGWLGYNSLRGKLRI